MKLRVNGYRSGDDQADRLIDLCHVGIEADHEALVALRSFLDVAIRDIERLGDKFSHVHFMDKLQAWNDSLPDIVIHTGNP